MLTGKQLKELWEVYQGNFPFSEDIRNLILSDIECLAELERSEFEKDHLVDIYHRSSKCKTCQEWKERRGWTPAQWLDAKRKEILGE